MSISLYDKAIAAKIGSWVSDPSIKIMSPEETRTFFEYVADTNNDEIKLPLIAISRSKTITLTNPRKTPLSFDGAVIKLENDKAMQLTAIQCSIPYQLDVYTERFEQADDYVRNFTFNLINHPQVQIIIPYNNCNFTHTSNITLSPQIEDNSAIPEHMFRGQFTRFTFEFTIDDAYLFSVPVRDNVKVTSELEVKFKEED